MGPITLRLRPIIGSPVPAFVIEEFMEALPAIVFFAIGFNLVVLTTQLILDDYAAQFAGFMVAKRRCWSGRRRWWRRRCLSFVGSTTLR